MGASSAGGSRGEGGSGGAFGGGGLQTGTKWHGTKAHFASNGQLKGYSTKGGAFKTPSGQSMGGGGNKTGGQGLKSLPKPLEFTVRPNPVINPPPVNPVSNFDAAYSSMFMRNPTAFPQGATGWRQGYAPTTNFYDALRSSIPPGNDFTGGWNNMNNTTINKNNMGGVTFRPASASFYNAYKSMNNPTNYMQHTQSIAGNPLGRLNTYSPRKDQSRVTNGQGF